MPLIPLIEPLECRRLFSSVTFAVIGDYGSYFDSGAQAEGDVSNLVKSWNPSFIVTAGDNNYPHGEGWSLDGNVGQFYQQYVSPYSGAYGAGAADGLNHFFPTLGNHDWDTGSIQPYLNYFTLPNNERYYDVTVGPVEIFAIDSEPQEVDGTSATSFQANWLKNQLAVSTAKWKLVVFHEPAYSSGRIGSNLTLRWPFQSWGASAVISGHDHDYERLLEDNNFPYFVDGLGGDELASNWGTILPGSQARYNADYGAMRVDASDTSVTFEFINRQGQVIDTYTMGSSTTGVPAAPTNLSAKVVGSSSQINLGWSDNSNNETGFKIERSTDDVNFTQIAAVAANVSTYSDPGLTAGSKCYYRVRATNAAGNSSYSNVASATISTTALPAPWLDQDIGNTGLPGSAAYSGGTYTVKGAGKAIGGSSDAFHFVYQSLSDNGQITARVTSIQNTGSGARAAVMIRQSLGAASPYAMMAVTPAGLQLDWRRTPGGSDTAMSAAGAAPTWLRLLRTGLHFRAYASSDGNTWTLLAQTTILMTERVYIGLAVMSGSITARNTSVFNNVAVRETPVLMPLLLGGDTTAAAATAVWPDVTPDANLLPEPEVGDSLPLRPRRVRPVPVAMV